MLLFYSFQNGNSILKVILTKRNLKLVTFLISILSVISSLVSAPTQVNANSAVPQYSSPADSRPPPEIDNPQIVYFAETGHYLQKGFKNFWLKNGGLAQFGYPLTEEFEELNPSDRKLYNVQYFERARFEYHPEFAGTFYEVELGLLGSVYTRGRHFDLSQPFVGSQSYYFPETHHSLSQGFKNYWDNNGGLAIYGYPISEEITEGGYKVQYFERARFEYHPENRGTAYETLLGLLGTSALESSGYALPQLYTVNLENSTLVQGHTLSIKVSGPDLSKVKSIFNGTSLDLRRVKGDLYSISGIASNSSLQKRDLITEIVDNTGTIRRFNRVINIIPGTFESQTLELDPGVEADLGTPEDAQREYDRDYGFYSQITSEKLWQGRFAWPVRGPITTQFGTRRNYVGGGSEIHDGIDIGVPSGTPVLAPQYGLVVLAELQKIRGNIIILDHGLGLHSGYFHMSRINVKPGDLVKPGDVMGYAGTTGLSTGAHLHWELRIGKIGVNPGEWLTKDFYFF